MKQYCEQFFKRNISNTRQRYFYNILRFCLVYHGLNFIVTLYAIDSIQSGQDHVAELRHQRLSRNAYQLRNQ